MPSDDFELYPGHNAEMSIRCNKLISDAVSVSPDDGSREALEYGIEVVVDFDYELSGQGPCRLYVSNGAIACERSMTVCYLTK
jgi:hypothetical protein